MECRLSDVSTGVWTLYPPLAPRMVLVISCVIRRLRIEGRTASVDTGPRWDVILGVDAGGNHGAANDHAAIQQWHGVALGLGIHRAVEGVGRLVFDGLVFRAAWHWR